MRLEDKKTKEKKRITYCDTLHFYETEQDAKHFAATYALHRFCSGLSIHRLLPPTHQTYWADLDALRKSCSPDTQLYDYAPDPFLAIEARAKAERAREKAAKDESDRKQKETERSERPWEAFPEVRMSTEVRTLVEELIKSVGTSVAVQHRVGSHTSGIGGAGKDKDNKSVIAELVSKGFRKVHAAEAMEYCHNATEAMNWLCLHVPEDGKTCNLYKQKTHIIMSCLFLKL
jgi:ATP-dependent RNA helicase DHX57